MTVGNLGRSPGDAGPCAGCGTRIHRYGPGCSSHCRDCAPGTERTGCRRCGRGPTRPYLNAVLCAACAPVHPPSDTAGVSQTQDRRGATGSTPDDVYAARWRRLQELVDTLGTRGARALATPEGAVRAVPRPCSTCKLPTRFTTPRGRSVHPCCEGWQDTVPESAVVEVTWLLSAALGVHSITTVPTWQPG